MRNELKSGNMDLRQLIEKEIGKTISTIENEVLKSQFDYCLQPPGRLFRSRLSLLVAEALGGNLSVALPFGVALELVQTFTLVHDDIMDSSKLRRGKQSVWAEYGTPSAILLGDALFAKAFEKIGSMDVCGEQKAALVDLLSQSVFRVAEGQQMDMEFEELPEVEEIQYVRMIERKTAALFVAATEGGAIVACAKGSLRNDMRQFGRSIGMAFQILDDLGDLIPDAAIKGKTARGDVRRGKKTLILIDAFASLDESKTNRLTEIISHGENAKEEELDEAVNLLQESGAIDRAREKLAIFVDEIKLGIERLPNTDAKNQLMQLINEIFPIKM